MRVRRAVDLAQQEVHARQYGPGQRGPRDGLGHSLAKRDAATGPQKQRPFLDGSFPPPGPARQCRSWR